MDHRQPIADDPSQPEKHRHAGIAQIALHPLRQVEEAVLKHVGGIDPTLQPRVHAELDHPPQAVAVLLEQLGQRTAIPSPEPLEQADGFTRWVVPGLAHTLYPAGRRGFGTRKMGTTSTLSPNMNVGIPADIEPHRVAMSFGFPTLQWPVGAQQLESLQRSPKRMLIDLPSKLTLSIPSTPLLGMYHSPFVHGPRFPGEENVSIAVRVLPERGLIDELNTLGGVDLLARSGTASAPWNRRTGRRTEGAET